MPETTEVAESITPEWTPYRGESYTELAETAGVAPGGDLVKGDSLIGVPFVITAMTFRVGDYMSAVTKVRGAYVTVECLTGDERAFKRAVKRGRLTEEDNVFDPEEEIIFNEGGTGAYRQAVLVWESLGWVKLPDGPDGGPYGESRLDTQLSNWEILSFTNVNVLFTPEGDPVYSAPVRLVCPRGLRASEYENEYTKEGRTRYFG